MISRVDGRFRLEMATYDLRCTCPACAAFEPERRSCAYGYPTAPHLQVPEPPSAVSAAGASSEPHHPECGFSFCKAFELA